MKKSALIFSFIALLCVSAEAAVDFDYKNFGRRLEAYDELFAGYQARTASILAKMLLEEDKNALSEYNAINSTVKAIRDEIKILRYYPKFKSLIDAKNAAKFRGMLSDDLESSINKLNGLINEDEKESGKGIPHMLKLFKTELSVNLMGATRDTLINLKDELIIFEKELDGKE
jgi:hypothetical protein